MKLKLRPAGERAPADVAAALSKCAAALERLTADWPRCEFCGGTWEYLPGHIPDCPVMAGRAALARAREVLGD